MSRVLSLSGVIPGGTRPAPGSRNGWVQEPLARHGAAWRRAMGWLVTRLSLSPSRRVADRLAVYGVTAARCPACHRPAGVFVRGVQGLVCRSCADIEDARILDAVQSALVEPHELCSVCGGDC